MSALIEWLTGVANPVTFDSTSAADRSWQEQQDAARTALSLADFPASALAAWKRPDSEAAPYLAGLIPEPFENSSIDHDLRTPMLNEPLLGNLSRHPDFRCDVQVLCDSGGRRVLEIANVNATPIESRLGTDLIYYHEPTRSFVMVQYKRLLEARMSRLSWNLKVAVPHLRSTEW